jgi:hypothetical protein
MDWLRRAIALLFGGARSDRPVEDDDRERVRDANAADIDPDAGPMPMNVSGSPDDRDEADGGDDDDGDDGGDGGGGDGGGGDD